MKLTKQEQVAVNYFTTQHELTSGGVVVSDKCETLLVSAFKKLTYPDRLEKAVKKVKAILKTLNVRVEEENNVTHEDLFHGNCIEYALKTGEYWEGYAPRGFPEDNGITFTTGAWSSYKFFAKGSEAKMDKIAARINKISRELNA